MWAIYKRELKSYFYSPLAYIMTGVYTFILSLYFSGHITAAAGPTQLLFGAIIYNLNIMLAFMMPILTMKVIADEKRNGTEVLLMTSPNSVPRIVFGKYLAAFTVFVAMAAITAMYPIIIAIFGKLNVASMITSYLGYILCGALFVAFGVFTSSLTESPIVSAVIGALSLFFIWIIDFFSTALRTWVPIVYDIAKWISFYSRFLFFVQGKIGLKDFVYFFSLTALFLALAMIRVEKKRWSRG